MRDEETKLTEEQILKLKTKGGERYGFQKLAMKLWVMKWVWYMYDNSWENVSPFFKQSRRIGFVFSQMVN